MILPVLLLFQAAPTGNCAALPLPMTRESSPTVTAVADGAPMMPLGQAVRATLLPTAAVTLAVPSDRAAAPGSSAGVFGFVVPTPGRYRVSLDAGVWVDVVEGGRAVASVAHGHGAPCTAVRKMVYFDLRPGAYRLQLVGSASPTVAVLIARTP